MLESRTYIDREVSESQCVVVGTLVAMTRPHMGAVFLLICLPITAALGFILMTTHSEASTGALMAGTVFLLLCGVIAAGAFKMARGWDEEQGHH